MSDGNPVSHNAGVAGSSPAPAMDVRGVGGGHATPSATPGRMGRRPGLHVTPKSAAAREKRHARVLTPWTPADAPEAAETLAGRFNGEHKKLPITREELQHAFDYDPEAGVFLWRNPRGQKARVGTVAGTRRPDGYIHLCYNYRLFMAHRAAWLWVHGFDTPMLLDHINGVRDDNRIANLREADWSQNSLNNAKNRARERAA